MEFCMMKPNQDIRELIKKSPFKSYEVAKALGYSSGSALSTKLQTELSDDERQYFIQKIRSMSDDNLNDDWRIRRYINQEVKIEPTYISEILRKINQLRADVDTASTKEDFVRISKLAEQISREIK
jgi:hypothetical protein